jgi:cell division transport system permease protein
MQALAQREEIGVARLVGATESFVRRPFLYLGALTGIVASGIAVGLSAIALQPLNTALARLAASYGTQLALHLPDGVSLLLSTIVIAILAALAARWSVTRNTRI